MTTFPSLKRLSRSQDKAPRPTEDMVETIRAEYDVTHKHRTSRLGNQRTSLALFDLDQEKLAESKNDVIELVPHNEPISPVDPALQNLDSLNRLSIDLSVVPILPEPSDEQQPSSSRFSHRFSSVLSPPKRPSVSRKSSDLTELLCSAASTGDTQYLGRILGAGASLTKRNAAGLSPLHVAAQAGQNDSIRCLVRMGAPIGGKDAKGYTPLHRAVMAGQRHVIAHLTNLGADVNEKTADGQTALHIAASLPFEKAAQVPRRESAPNALRESTSLRFSYAFNGASGSRRGSRDSATSMKEYDECPIIEALIRAGADKECRDGHGETAVHAAVRAGDMQNLTILLDQGAGVNVSNTAGLTPLGILAEKNDGHEDMMAFLLSRGAIVTPIERKKGSWFSRAVL
jgi:ankyrin repeat protein